MLIDLLVGSIWSISLRLLLLPESNKISVFCLIKVSFRKWHPQLIKKNILAYEIVYLLFGELEYFALLCLIKSNDYIDLNQMLGTNMGLLFSETFQLKDWHADLYCFAQILVSS